MEESTQKEHMEKRLDDNPIIFSRKYGKESGSITPGKNIFSIFDQFYEL